MSQMDNPGGADGYLSMVGQMDNLGGSDGYP